MSSLVLIGYVAGQIYLKVLLTGSHQIWDTQIILRVSGEQNKCKYFNIRCGHSDSIVREVAIIKEKITLSEQTKFNELSI